MPHSVFKHEHRIAYSECTLGDHVYYARYLDLLERVRGEFFRQLGQTFRQMQGTDTTFPVIECTLRYKAPARYDDVLTTEVWLALVERARLNFNYRIRNQEKRLILEAETLHVCAVLNGKPKRISEELLAMLRPYLQEIGR